MSECATALEGWKKLQPTMSNKSAKQQVEAIERLVDEEHEKARGCLDDLLAKTPDMKRTFLAQLPEKLVGENFVLTEGDVRTLTAFGISPEDQRKLISNAAKAHANKSLSAAVDTEWKTGEGAKKYTDWSSLWAQYAAKAQELYKDAEGRVKRVSTALAQIGEAWGSLMNRIADQQDILKEAQEKLTLSRRDLSSKQADVEKIRAELSQNPKDSTLTNRLATVNGEIAVMEANIVQMEANITEINKVIVSLGKDRRKMELEQWTLDTELAQESVAHTKAKDASLAAETRHQISIEDMRAAVKLSKDMRQYRIDRVQGLYAELIGTLPPTTESVDYSQGNGYVLQRMYTILIESGGNKAHKGEVEVATRELQVLFGIETTGKIGPKLLDALESHVRKQKEQKLQELKRVEPKAVV